MSIEHLHSSGSPERILRDIENREIDIENFDGFLIWTQVPNIPSIMKSGLQIPSERKEVRWKYGGRLNERWQDSLGTYLTIYDSANHSFAEGKYPWPKAGQVGILIDKSLDASLWSTLAEELGKTDEEVYKETIQVMYEDAIPPDLIRGLVMNQNNIALENPRDTIEKSIPSFEEGKMTVEKYQQPQPFSFEREDYIEMLKTRLDRLAKDGNRNLVPLYNNDGSVIWPVQAEE
jgi:hypothetical protein